MQRNQIKFGGSSSISTPPTVITSIERTQNIKLIYKPNHIDASNLLKGVPIRVKKILSWCHKKESLL
jgi:hypothetical protein